MCVSSEYEPVSVCVLQGIITGSLSSRLDRLELDTCQSHYKQSCHTPDDQAVTNGGVTFADVTVSTTG